MPTVAVLPFYRIGSTPLALEIMRIYNAGSSVYASVYADAAGTVPLGNSDLVPIQADGNGLPRLQCRAFDERRVLLVI